MFPRFVLVVADTRALKKRRGPNHATSQKFSGPCDLSIPGISVTLTPQ